MWFHHTSILFRVFLYALLFFTLVFLVQIWVIKGVFNGKPVMNSRSLSEYPLVVVGYLKSLLGKPWVIASLISMPYLFLLLVLAFVFINSVGHSPAFTFKVVNYVGDLSGLSILDFVPVPSVEVPSVEVPSVEAPSVDLPGASLEISSGSKKSWLFYLGFSVVLLVFLGLVDEILD